MEFNDNGSWYSEAQGAPGNQFESQMPMNGNGWTHGQNTGTAPPPPFHRQNGVHASYGQDQMNTGVSDAVLMQMQVPTVPARKKAKMESKAPSPDKQMMAEADQLASQIYERAKTQATIKTEQAKSSRGKLFNLWWSQSRKTGARAFKYTGPDGKPDVKIEIGAVCSIFGKENEYFFKKDSSTVINMAELARLLAIGQQLLAEAKSLQQD